MSHGGGGTEMCKKVSSIIWMALFEVQQGYTITNFLEVHEVFMDSEE